MTVDMTLDLSAVIKARLNFLTEEEVVKLVYSDNFNVLFLLHESPHVVQYLCHSLNPVL